MNRNLIKIEGLLVFAACIYAYVMSDYKLLWFFAFLLLPDLSMFGYLGGNRIGAISYNLAHTYVISGLILFLGILANSDMLIQVGLIWTAHIGMDRVMGYGLKYETHFKDTHLNRI
ncbi:hypothetical protein SY83_04200 [Paenibacillus swuensis]|uniref:DUF4260 domain-containing protein n=1 Tax=Paenibacillus swuensis TaxID=1178515 RepID=A0A172TF98_9BACL|nr:DUF4260 domain-containing protein [Paenibacillus swuensis]ANE45632.1 hypothetical protein SY83_04200 [Paenibacillus swuensis]